MLQVLSPTATAGASFVSLYALNVLKVSAHELGDLFRAFLVVGAEDVDAIQVVAAADLKLGLQHANPRAELRPMANVRNEWEAETPVPHPDPVDGSLPAVV